MTVERGLFPSRLHEDVGMEPIVGRFDHSNLQEDDCQVRLLLQETSSRKLFYFRGHDTERPTLVCNTLIDCLNKPHGRTWDTYDWVGPNVMAVDVYCNIVN